MNTLLSLTSGINGVDFDIILEVVVDDTVLVVTELPDLLVELTLTSGALVVLVLTLVLFSLALDLSDESPAFCPFPEADDEWTALESRLFSPGMRLSALVVVLVVEGVVVLVVEVLELRYNWVKGTIIGGRLWVCGGISCDGCGWVGPD